MKRVWRFITLLVLASFVGLSIAEAAHVHTQLEISKTCSICQVAPHQAILNVSQISHFLRVVHQVDHLNLPRPDVAFVFQAHGLAPPIL